MSEIRVDTISEKTSGSGVTIDGVLIKDTTIDVNGTAGALILDTDADTKIQASTDDNIEFFTAGKKQFNLTSFGSVQAFRDSATTFGPSFNGQHQRGTIASPTIVSDGDRIAEYKSSVYDGTAYLDGPRISFRVDGTPGDDDMPTRMEFQVGANGTASLYAAMTLHNDGSLVMNPIANSITVFNENGVDSDFRVEGANQTHAIFMNAGLDHVNFGSSDASLYQVDIKDATDFVPGSSNTANAAPLRVRSAASTGNLGAIAIGGNNNNGIFNGANNFLTLQGYEAIQFRNQQLNDDKLGTKAEVHRMEAGNFYWNRISQTLSGPGMWLSSANQLRITVQADDVLTVNREGDDGNLVLFRQANSTEGTISVSGSTVSYNGFTGTHWSRLADNSKPTILRGTIMESINTMMDWYQAVADVAEVKYTSDDPETKPVLCEAGHPEVEDGTANIGDVRQAAMKNVGDVKSAAMKIKESILYLKVNLLVML